MQFHIKIPKVTEFYLTISRTNPGRQVICEVERSNPPQRLEEDQMERNLDRTNMWISNCDQKASFLLALVGVVITVIFTSGVTPRIIQTLVNPFIDYCKDGVGSFCFWRTMDALLFISGLVLIFLSMSHLLLCLMAKTDYSKFQQPGMEQKSHLFFGHIASMTYDEFCHTDVDKYNDLLSQVYTNSVICSDKFKNYRKGAKAVFLALPILTASFLLLMFV